MESLAGMELTSSQPLPSGGGANSEK
jgi:hypothetical protein